MVEELESRGVESMQVAFFTVDPKRDTAERMSGYVALFDEGFVGVTGETGDMRVLTSALGLVVSFSANEESPEDNTVDHTASILLIDPTRRVRAEFSPPHERESIVADYLTLMAECS